MPRHSSPFICRKTKINHFAPFPAPFLFFRRQVRRKNSLQAKTAYKSGFQEHRGGIGGDRVQAENC